MLTTRSNKPPSARCNSQLRLQGAHIQCVECLSAQNAQQTVVCAPSGRSSRCSSRPTHAEIRNSLRASRLVALFLPRSGHSRRASPISYLAQREGKVKHFAPLRPFSHSLPFSARFASSVSSREPRDAAFFNLGRGRDAPPRIAADVQTTKVLSGCEKEERKTLESSQSHRRLFDFRARRDDRRIAS